MKHKSHQVELAALFLLAVFAVTERLTFSTEALRAPATSLAAFTALFGKEIALCARFAIRNTETRIQLFRVQQLGHRNPKPNPIVPEVGEVPNEAAGAAHEVVAVDDRLGQPGGPVAAPTPAAGRDRGRRIRTASPAAGLSGVHR